MGAEPSKNPNAPGVKEKAAMATVDGIASEAARFDVNQNLFSVGTWANEELKGTYFCSPSGQYVTDNTDPYPANKLNLVVWSGATFNVDESNNSKFSNYEAFVVDNLMRNFTTGTGPENYNFPVNGVISSKFLNSDIFKAALTDFNKGRLIANETRQYSFGLSQLGSDFVRTGTLFSITGFVGSGTITFVPDAKGIYVKILNITSLSSGALVKNPNDMNTFPNSYVRDPNQQTPYGNISQTFNLFLPWESPLLNQKDLSAPDPGMYEIPTSNIWQNIH